MRMFFSIPRPKPVIQVQPQNIKNDMNNVKTNGKGESLVNANLFNNIFDRLHTSGKCKSCGH
jgi:hypothetical protein